MRIVCPWHGYEFSLESGAHPAKASIRLTRVAVEEEGGEVYVSL
jgi:nitrite reductase/ring-hydroxylating ferredoxin subunit